jgi:hypothetical protein
MEDYNKNLRNCYNVKMWHIMLFWAQIYGLVWQFTAVNYFLRVLIVGEVYLDEMSVEEMTVDVKACYHWLAIVE